MSSNLRKGTGGDFQGVETADCLKAKVATLKTNLMFLTLTALLLVPLLRWSRVVGTFDPAAGFQLYVNGQAAGFQEAKGNFTAAEGLDLLIGMARRKQFPALTERKPGKTFLSNMVFDGSIDEVRIYNRVLSADEIRAAYAANQPAHLQPLQVRRILNIPQGTDFRFGHRQTLEGTDLIVWITTESQAALTVHFEPQPRP